MMLASALVIDIGGPISHGAIVARELGIPCVIGTRDAAAQIRTGDRLRVDGGQGEVRVATASAAPTPEPPTITLSTRTRRQHDMDHELAVLQALRLKGRAGPEDLAAASGAEPEQVAGILSDLTQSGGAREVGGGYMLLAPGRERLAKLLEDELARTDSVAIRELHEEFIGVNLDFKQLAADWQTRDGEPNDHADPAYDQQVLDRLPSVHDRVTPILRRVGEVAPRLAYYQERLDKALERVRAGDHTWLLRPLIDSYHTVWFELHEELLSLAGLSREAEAASGRAE
jgi:pyruvate,orthophosphate dikinase